MTERCVKSATQTRTAIVVFVIAMLSIYSCNKNIQFLNSLPLYTVGP